MPMRCVGVLVFIVLLWTSNRCVGTPIDDYVNEPDPMFSWRRLQTYPLASHTLYVLNMTSQQWFDGSFSTQPVWWHYITITVPRFVFRSKIAFLLIGSGDNTDPIIKPRMPTTNPMTNLALRTNSITATIYQVPNQPFRFLEDPLAQSRDEDALIAWTWKKFLDANGTDPKVLLRFPMTKAAVRAMDTIQQFLEQQQQSVPEEFVLAGASKRGWTTWMAAAVDNKRVIGAVPIVMDLLNIRPNMMSHYRSLGGWTFAFYDYYVLNITLYMNSPVLDKLSAMVDPYSYLDRYQRTKIFQLQGAGDEFFLPDSEDFFWTDLQAAAGRTYLRRIPNTGHNIKGYDESLTSFYLSVADRTSLPAMNWNRTVNGTHGVIHVVIDTNTGGPQDIDVTAYQARTSDTLRRDFRQAKLDQTNGNVVPNPIVWTNIAVQLDGRFASKTLYSLTIPIPTDGFWIAAFVQASFPGREGTTLTLTTETLILPNTYSLPECNDRECYGRLV